MDRIKTNRFTLSFLDSSLEKDFNEDYYFKSLTQRRFALIAGMFIFSIFGVLDYWLVPQISRKLLAIRIISFLPVMLFVYLLSYSKYSKKYLQSAVLLAVIFTGWGIVYMILSAPDLLASYYVCLIILIYFAHTYVCMRFVCSSIAGLVILLTYEITFIWLSPISGPRIINNNFFLLSGFVLSMMAGYSIELFNRRAFIQSRQLDIEKQKVNKINMELEKRVAERTTQLLKTNEELKQKITERKLAGEEMERAFNQLKEIQQQLIHMEKLKIVGELSSGIAHEVKNPLGIILQGINYLESHIVLDDNKTKEVFHAIKSNIKRADNIISGLVDFSRSTKLELFPEDINLIIENSLSMILYRVKLESIRVIKELKKDLPKVVIDSAKMEQVFANLLLNAVHAMPNGGTLFIRSCLSQINEIAHKTYMNNVYDFKYGDPALFIEVEDTGIGISKESLQRIYDPFFTTKEPGKGTGLGLSITKSIIDMHKGIIDIKSQEGKGTKVIIILKIFGGE